MTQDRHPTSCSDAQLHAYVDGHLDLAGRQRVETMLEQQPELAARVAAWQRQNSALREAMAPIDTAPIPAALSDMLQRRRGPRQWSGGIARIAAALALLFIGGAGGWLARDQLTPEMQEAHAVDLVSSALAAHRIYAVEVRHPVEVGADEETHLVAWLSKRLGRTLVAPRLTDMGFALVGGRLLPTTEGPAAQLMYQNATGQRITLYLLATAGKTTTAFRMTEQNDISLFYWIDGGLGCAIAGPIDRNMLMKIARLAYEQIDNGLPAS